MERDTPPRAPTASRRCRGVMRSAFGGGGVTEFPRAAWLARFDRAMECTSRRFGEPAKMKGMARVRIKGGVPISGEFRPSGNKNAALPMLAASLLTDEPVVLHNVPDILDVAVMLELLSWVGVEVQRSGATVRLWAREPRRRRLPESLCSRIRASMLLAGPLALRLGCARLYAPGGDLIGRRRLDAHVSALAALGIHTQMGSPIVVRRRGSPSSAIVLLEEASVTATEHALMVAAGQPCETTLYNAACEPHVEDLVRMLSAMGAHVEPVEPHGWRVRGREKLRGAEVTIGPDHIEMGSYLCAAAVTGGALTIQNPPDELACRICHRGFDLFGVEWRCERDRLYQPARARLRVRPMWHGAIPKIEDGPWPAFPSDLMSLVIVMATQARGTTLVFEKMFESRLYFVDRLMDMGAHVVVCDPHRVIIVGPTRLRGTRVASPDIRAGMGMVVAALCARGESIIENAEVIDRGYERWVEKLARLGANIDRD